MKKNIMYGMMISLIIITNCSSPETPYHIGEKNKAIVEKYIQAVMSGDQKTVSELLSDDFKGYGPYQSDSTNKTQELENFSKNWNERFKTIDYKPVYSLTNTVNDGRLMGDWVLSWGTLNVSYKNGRAPVTFSAHIVFKLKDGKIALIGNYWNSADIMKQQGFKFVPPEE
jgi:ketosteroid isomerase-like protein